MPVLALLALIASGLVMAALQKPWSAGRRFPWLSLATLALVAAMLALQHREPALLTYLGRTPALLAEGQVWRAITALFVQDGNLAGGLFNLTILTALGPLAETRLGPARWALAYFGGGIVTEFAALALQPYGAGNSIACFALAGTLIVTGLAQRRHVVSLVAALSGVAAGCALLARQDIHGIGFLAGMIIGAVLVWQDRRAALIAPA